MTYRLNEGAGREGQPSGPAHTMRAYYGSLNEGAGREGQPFGRMPDLGGDASRLNEGAGREGQPSVGWSRPLTSIVPPQ